MDFRHPAERVPLRAQSLRQVGQRKKIGLQAWIECASGEGNSASATGQIAGSRERRKETFVRFWSSDDHLCSTHC